MSDQTNLMYGMIGVLPISRNRRRRHVVVWTTFDVFVERNTLRDGSRRLRLLRLHFLRNGFLKRFHYFNIDRDTTSKDQAKTWLTVDVKLQQAVGQN